MAKIKNSVNHFFDNFSKVVRRTDMVLLPGNLAFFFVLAVVPSVGLISYGASILNLNTNFLFEFLEKMFSTDLANMILGVSYTGMPLSKFIITIVIGFYVASNGADCIITTSNAIYGIDNGSWVKRRFKAFGMTLMLVLLFIFMLVVPVFGNAITDIITEANLHSEIASKIILVFNIIEGPITWVIIFLMIKLLYSIAPSKRGKNRVTNYGAIFTSVLWIVGTSVYAYYANNFASYTALYGGLANVVILMIWVYFLSYVFTVGIALNYREDENKLEKTGTIKKIK